jgi:hypothetical protein
MKSMHSTPHASGDASAHSSHDGGACLMRCKCVWEVWVPQHPLPTMMHDPVVPRRSTAPLPTSPMASLHYRGAVVERGGQGTAIECQGGAHMTKWQSPKLGLMCNALRVSRRHPLEGSSHEFDAQYTPC